MTPLQLLYGAIVTQTWWANIIIGVLATIILGLYISARTRSCGYSLIALIVLVVHLIAAPIMASHYAGDAVTNGVEAAKNENKTYVQKLHGFFTDYGEDFSDCSGPKYEPLGAFGNIDEGRKATGCYYIRLEKDSDDDYWWVPMFTRERRPWGWLNIYKDQKVYFADHNIAMKDWENYKGGLLGINGPRNNETFEYQDPADWSDLVTRLEAGEVVEGSKYNNYFNYLLPTDTIVKDDWSSKLSLYEGNLPAITPIHNTYRYEFVQFGNGIALDAQTLSHWQKSGSLWGTNAGPMLEGSTLVQFVLASQIDDPDNHIKASKAALMQDSYGKEALPKNLILVECGISDDYSLIKWCRFQQGMFRGNHEIANAIASISDVPFTPEAFFGNITASSTRVENPTPGNRFEVTVSYDNSGVMGQFYTLFKRIEMAESEYLDTLIKPTDAQMEQIKQDALKSVLTAIGTVYVLIVGAIAKSSKRS